MLSILRKKASSWITKIILGTIAIVFIFFFGSSTLRSPQQGKQVLAEVNGYNITDGMVTGMVRLQKDTNPVYKNLPESFEPHLRQSILNNLINGLIAQTEALKLGFRVSNREISDVIKKTPSLWKDGKFNAEFYHDRFRPWYSNNYGMDFEEGIRRDLLLEKIRNVFTDALALSDKEIENQFILENTKIKVNRIEIDPAKLAEDYIPTNEEVQTKLQSQGEKLQVQDNLKEKARIVQELKKEVGMKKAEALAKELWPFFITNQSLKKQLEEHNLSEREIPLTSLAHVESLFGGSFDTQATITLFGLSTNNPFPEAPLKVGGKIYFFKLLAKESPSLDKLGDLKKQKKEEWAAKLARRFYGQWLQKAKNKAKIKRIEQ